MVQQVPSLARDAAAEAGLAAACPREATEDPAALRRAAAQGIVELNRTFRFGGRIAQLATAIHEGDADGVMSVLASADDEVAWVDTGKYRGPEQAALACGLRGQVAEQADLTRQAALAGDAPGALAAMMEHRVLCAHRDGPFGVSRWSALVAGWSQLPPDAASGWQPGQGLLITANDSALGLFNGDAGVIVAGPDTQPIAAFPRGREVAEFPPIRLGEVASLYALTIHKSQGSQFGRVSVVLPEADSRILTRELLYTAVTRARHGVRIIGSQEAIVAAVGRRVHRASGLRF